MPATMPATNSISGSTFRGAALTIYQTDSYTQLPEKLSYFAYAVETCPTTGRQHLQAFAYSVSAMRLTGWKKIFPTAHIESMKGTFSQNEAYCSKEGTLVEFGIRPMENGHRRSDLIVKELIDADPNKTIMQHYEDTSERSALVYERAFKSYREHKRAKLMKGDHSAPEVHYIYGHNGTGKSRYVRDLEPDIYQVPSLSWFDNYEGQDAVLFDNFEGPGEHRTQFLTYIDRYPIQVPVKCGFTWWKPKRIYITSTLEPADMASQFRERGEFYRRITVFKHLKKSLTEINGL